MQNICKYSTEVGYVKINHVIMDIFNYDQSSMFSAVNQMMRASFYTNLTI